MDIQNDIKKYEIMAKLSFDDGEREWALSALEHILADLGVLDGISTDGVLPLVCLSDVSDVLREDKALPSNIVSLLMNNAPDSENGYLKVPKAVE